MSALSKQIKQHKHLIILIWKDLIYRNHSFDRRMNHYECISSVLLAITMSHVIGLPHVGWAAFSGFMVMRGHISITLVRGGLRIIGTVAGAVLAWLCSVCFPQESYMYSILLAAVCGFSIYRGLFSSRSYAWLFMGLTFCLVFIEGIEGEMNELKVFAMYRIGEVMVGTCCSVFISFLSTKFVRKEKIEVKSIQKSISPLKLSLWHRLAFIHSLQAAAAVAVIPWVWYFFHIQALAQSGVTIMVAMFIPISEIGRKRFTSRKLAHRIFGCVIGGTYSFLVLFIAHSVPWIIYPAIVLSVYVGSHIQSGRLHINYVGTQIVLATLIVMAPDSIAAITGESAVDRLIGIFCGLIILEPVRYVSRLIPYPVKFRGV